MKEPPEIPGITDRVIENISNFDVLNAPTLADGNKKFLEQLTPEIVKQELIKLGPAFTLIRFHNQVPAYTYFDEAKGFPLQYQNGQLNPEFYKLKTGDVMDGYREWVKNETEVISTWEREILLYASTEGYFFLQAYYYFEDTDSWKATQGKISSAQSYKNENYPSDSDVQAVLKQLKKPYISKLP